MNDSKKEPLAVFEREMNEALRNVALEIRSVDVLELASFIHSEKFSNIGDIVHSAMELYFKPHALLFSYSGEVRLNWFGGALVALDMELHAGEVDVYFRLNIDALNTDVQFRHATIGGRPLISPLDASRFSAALQEAKFQCEPVNGGPFSHAVTRGQVF
jgi:hypothetical protein